MPRGRTGEGAYAVRGLFASMGRPRLRAGVFPACLILVASAFEPAARGDAPASEAIRLRADSIAYWDEGPSRCVRLTGHVKVAQGGDETSADRAVARITTDSGARPPVYRMEIYGEGRVRRGADGREGPALRWSLETVGEVKMTSNTPGALEHRDGPTDDDRTLIGRGFALADDGRPIASAPAPSGTTAAPAVAQAAEEPPPVAPEPKRDAALERGQFVDDLIQEAPAQPPGVDGGEMPATDPAPADLPDAIESPAAPPLLEPFEDDVIVPPTEVPPLADPPPGAVAGPVLPENRRVIQINPRDSRTKTTVESLTAKDGTTTTVYRGGVNVVAEQPGRGTLELSADSVVVWTHPRQPGGMGPDAAGGRLEQNGNEPLEMYLEGNVVFRQDKRQVAGNGDQILYRGERLYYDFSTEGLLAEQAEVNVFAPGLVAPARVAGSEIRQFRELVGQDGNRMLWGPTRIRADRTTTTGSRFPDPGYKFNSRAVDLVEKDAPLTDPLTGRPVDNPKDPAGKRDRVWRVDARGNVYYIGPVPVFYWPRVVMDSDDLNPPLRNLQFRANNYFGQQILSDWNVFTLTGIRRPNWIDSWNLDVDYLSYRSNYPAIGSEIGWFGRNIIGDLLDPYHDNKNGREVYRPYAGYFDTWGINDHKKDVLGPGPSVLTNVPDGLGHKGFQRTDTPFDTPNPYSQFRGRYEFRHMQSLLGMDAPDDRDFRLQLESGYATDRNFLEQYYKRLFDSGMDEGTLAYGIYQDRNRAFSLLSSANLQYWYTDTQYFPKFDYYRFGDNFFNLFSWTQNSGIDYANTHTDIMVNSPKTFAFQPFDPVSATSGPFRTGRAWTNQQLEMPINLNVLRLVPYAQGQLVGWDNQYQTALPNPLLVGRIPESAFVRGPQGAMLGRAWGAVGARANVMAWKNYSFVESELLNVHGISHKINFDVDFRAAYSNVPVNRIGVQDQLDDNTYEYVRRYFALTNYVGGVLPAQYDPRYLYLRRAINPITGTTDLQDTIMTSQFGLRQRLQTKRGPEGKRRVTDWMILDLQTTYFPNADRDNFGRPFGQNMYNYEWYLGDRTSFVSTGWFEFWDVTGRPILLSNPTKSNDPFGLRIITNGISITRPPRANIYIGYSIINTGPIATSALNTAFAYWLSPKWYGTFSTSYDFGNGILLGSTFSVTKIGADFLTSIGLSVDPQRSSYTFGFELSPRLSPSTRLGSGGGPYRVDSRFAPTQ